MADLKLLFEDIPDYGIGDFIFVKTKYSLEFYKVKVIEKNIIENTNKKSGYLTLSLKIVPFKKSHGKDARQQLNKLEEEIRSRL